jgi:hypothetical protein
MAGVVIQYIYVTTLGIAEMESSLITNPLKVDYENISQTAV